MSITLSLKPVTMLRSTFLYILLISATCVFAQQTDCKVLIPGISGTYSGGCKKGLANGKGVAQGIDRYEGQFSKGLPYGYGTYTWASGVYYEGSWKKGLRDGEGKMVYPDSTVTGVWKEDKYMGKKAAYPYRIVSSLSVSRYTFTKSADKNNIILIRIMQGGLDNISIEDFSLAYDSGTEFRNGNYYGLENVRFPLTVKLKYRTWNQLMTSQSNVIFEFLINQPGSWKVVVVN